MGETATENPFEPPNSDLELSDDVADALRDGDQLVIPDGANLPGRCVICNKQATGVTGVLLANPPLPIWTLLFIVPIFLAIFLGAQYLIVQRMLPTSSGLGKFLWLVGLHGAIFLAPLCRWSRQTRIHFRFCRAHYRLFYLRHALYSGFIFAILLQNIVHQSTSDSISVRSTFVLVPLGLIMGLGGLWTSQVLNFFPKKEEVDETHIWVSGVGKPFLDSLPSYDHRERVTP